MDEYRKRAKERHEKYCSSLKRKTITENESSSLSSSWSSESLKIPNQPVPNPEDPWITLQCNTFRKLGFSESQTIPLLQKENLADCLNWKKEDWENEKLPFAFRYISTDDSESFILGYNLRDLFLLESVHGHSPLQTRTRLGWNAETWRLAVERWNLVNPYPLQSVSAWKSYNADVDPTPIAEAFGNQLYGIDSMGSKDVQGDGIVRVPPELMQYIQEHLSDTHWSGNHPFLVVQLAFQHASVREVMATDFAIMQFDQPLSQRNHIWISPAIRTRTGIRGNQQVHCRLVSLLPIRHADSGVGVRLRYCGGSDSGVSPPTPEQLQSALEKHYILVKGQWVTVVTNEDTVWIYRVQTLWSIHGRPVSCCSIYGAHVSIDIVTESKESGSESKDIDEILQNWTV